MAYNVENLTKLKHLKELAQRVSQDFATKAELNAVAGAEHTHTAAEVGALSVTGGTVTGRVQFNSSEPESGRTVIDGDKVEILAEDGTGLVIESTKDGYNNGCGVHVYGRDNSARDNLLFKLTYGMGMSGGVTILDMGDTPVQVPSQRGNGKDYAATVKDVEKMVPTKLSALTNDSGFQTSGEVSAAISAAISQSGHAVFEKVDAIPDAAGAQSNILYLVMNSKTKHYDIYAKVGEEVVRLDDTTVDLSGYVAKEEGKVLSSNDFTDELKAKLEAGPEAATDAEVAEMLAEVFGAAS